MLVNKLKIRKFFLGQELAEELERLRSERFEAERKREELIKRAKQMQGKSQNKRNQGSSKSHS